eukprot:1872155-Pyramimonas_sp.AAC.1
MRPALQREHDSERAEARTGGQRFSGSNSLKHNPNENPTSWNPARRKNSSRRGPNIFRTCR